jgi:iron(II)-dependent oxidoreductase
MNVQAPDMTSSSLRERAAGLLERTRQRTLELIEPLSEQALNEVHDPLMSPIVWDLGHIANFEDLWLVQRTSGMKPFVELGDVYDPFTTPRRDRGRLPYLRSEDGLAYLNAVRERTLTALQEADLSDESDRLLAGGFVYDLVARHEQQHSETILQTLQIMRDGYQPQHSRELPAEGEAHTGMVLVDAGPVEIGAHPDWFAYDNERPPETREVASFLIDVEPVTNGQVLEFIEHGGYERQEWWSEQGWQWRERERILLPRYWTREDGGFWVRSFGQLERVDPRKPACHVSWYEADAFARYAGKRLPTEAEWEKAASWTPEGDKRRYPWGDDEPSAERTNLDQLGFGTAPAGAYPNGASAIGARQLIGDVWEWTASGFEAYPGFDAFPYSEYSAPFFGGPFKVLRGGSWATQPEAVTTTFRNWDFPERRQIFAGFRCAQDAEPQRAKPQGLRRP